MCLSRPPPPALTERHVGCRGTVPTSSRPAMRKEGRGGLGGGARALAGARGLCSRTATWTVGRPAGPRRGRPATPLSPWLGFAGAQHRAGRGIAKAASANHGPRGPPAQAGPGSCPRALVLKRAPARREAEPGDRGWQPRGRRPLAVRSCAGGGASTPTPQTPYRCGYPPFPGGRGESIPPEFLYRAQWRPSGRSGCGQRTYWTGQEGASQAVAPLGFLGRPGADSRCAGMAPGEPNYWWDQSFLSLP